MHKEYHLQITQQALQERFSARALDSIQQANLGQDNLAGLIWHPEYHFDDSQFDQGYAYLDEQRLLVSEALARFEPTPAWWAFGRLTHAVQDFYAHSNYIQLWLARTENGQELSLDPGLTDPLDRRTLEDPNLISGRIYYPWEALSLIPSLAPIMRRLMPADSHTCLNLDGPEGGPRFAYALVAARKRTAHEFEGLRGSLSPGQLLSFCDQ